MTNDDELMTAVRADFAPVRMSVATDAIMARGRAARRLRRGQVAAGALAVALGAGLGIPALTSGGTASETASGGTASQVTLTAWTVDKQPDGAINVTIRDLQNLSALQAKLVADGAPVAVGIGAITLAPGGGLVTGLNSVTPSAGCQVGPTNPAPIPAAVTVYYTHTGYGFTIQPAKVPAGDMIRIAITKGGGFMTPGSPAYPAIFALLVRDTPRCAF